MANQPPPGPPYGGYPPPSYGPQPGYGYQQPPKKRGGFATAALVLGIIGLIMAIIPFVNYAAYPVVILAIVFGLLAIKWGKGKAGLILGTLGLIATILWSVAIAGAFDDAVNKKHTVVYSIAGTGKADIRYDQFDGSGRSSSASADAVTIPWSKTFTIKGSLSAFSVSATSVNVEKAVQLSCKVTVDGKVASQDSANSQAASVSCYGSGYDGD